MEQIWAKASTIADSLDRLYSMEKMHPRVPERVPELVYARSEILVAVCRLLRFICEAHSLELLADPDYITGGTALDHFEWILSQARSAVERFAAELSQRGDLFAERLALVEFAWKVVFDFDKIDSGVRGEVGPGQAYARCSHRVCWGALSYVQDVEPWTDGLRDALM
jgi:hypothetical protein